MGKHDRHGKHRAAREVPEPPGALEMPVPPGRDTGISETHDVDPPPNWDDLDKDLDKDLDADEPGVRADDGQPDR